MFKTKAKSRSGKERKLGVLYIVLAILCFIAYQALWLFGILFVVLAVANFYFASKHAENEGKVEEFLDKINENETDTDMIVEVEKILKVKKKKSREEEYKEYLKDVENEFADFDEDEYMYEDGE